MYHAYMYNKDVSQYYTSGNKRAIQQSSPVAVQLVYTDFLYMHVATHMYSTVYMYIIYILIHVHPISRSHLIHMSPVLSVVIESLPQHAHHQTICLAAVKLRMYTNRTPVVKQVHVQTVMLKAATCKRL